MQNPILVGLLPNLRASCWEGRLFHLVTELNGTPRVASEDWGKGHVCSPTAVVLWLVLKRCQIESPLGLLGALGAFVRLQTLSDNRALGSTAVSTSRPVVEGHDQPNHCRKTPHHQPLARRYKFSTYCNLQPLYSDHFIVVCITTF